MSQQKYPKAYEAYQQAVYRDGRNPTFWCSIGVLYYQINQYRDALDAYSRAIRLNPNISEVWYDLGTLVSLLLAQAQSELNPLTNYSTSRATTKPATRWTHTPELLTSTRATFTLKRAWRCSKGSPQTVCPTKAARHFRKTYIHRRTSPARLAVRRVHNGVLTPRTHRRPVQYLGHWLSGTIGVAVGWPTCKILRCRLSR